MRYARRRGVPAPCDRGILGNAENEKEKIALRIIENTRFSARVFCRLFFPSDKFVKTYAVKIGKPYAKVDIRHRLI